MEKGIDYLNAIMKGGTQLYNANSDGLLDAHTLFNYAMKYGERCEQIKGEVYDAFTIYNPLLFSGEGNYSIRVLLSGDCKTLYVAATFLKRDNDGFDWFFEGKERISLVYKLGVKDVSTYQYKNTLCDTTSKLTAMKLKTFDLLFIEDGFISFPVAYAEGYVNRGKLILGNYESNPYEVLKYSKSY